MTEQPITSPPPRKKLLWGTLTALAAAAVALVVFILPAEYGTDPTGAGRALGVTKLSEPTNIYLERGRKRQGVLLPLGAGAQPDEATLRQVLAAQGKALPPEKPVTSDRFEFELQPFEGIELKYELAQGTPMIFAWRATAPVNYDMHAHPFAGGDKLTESYSITDAQSQSAVYVAPFTGIHGWYWQNQTLDPVTLTLDARGAIISSRTFDHAGEHPRPLAPQTAGGGPAPARSNAAARE